MSDDFLVDVILETRRLPADDPNPTPPTTVEWTPEELEDLDERS